MCHAGTVCLLKYLEKEADHITMIKIDMGIPDRLRTIKNEANVFG
ncbi:hypothetical protein SAMN04487771_10634 [[Clostridium] aminophilum]|uniref:Uncharacterized protein n=1 Tax=[Clostridium] aminophilum TaxID=1526 RepID=A0A1I0HZC3_9FIRM|nr:hypothetical protein SAMN04487771_10634 [[Clostridium] aminophilum]